MDEVELTLECVTTSEEAVVYLVNPSAWKASVDPGALRDQSDVRQWYAGAAEEGPALQQYVPKSVPTQQAGHGVFYVARDEAFEVLVVSVPNTQSPESNQIMAMDALTEFEQEVVFLSNAADPQQDSKASLFTLLDVLLKTCTSDQSAHITHAVFSFLQSEITLNRLYSQLTNIVGYATIRKIVNQIDQGHAAPPAPSAPQQPAPPESALVVESLSSILKFKKEHPPGYPVPRFAFATDNAHSAFFNSPKIPRSAFHISERATEPWHVDLPSSGGSSILHRVGAVAIPAGDYLLLVGGVLGTQHTSASNGWETLTLIEQQSFRSVDHELTGPLPEAQFGAGAVLMGSFSGSDDHLAVFGGAKSLSVVTDAVASGGRTLQAVQMSSELKLLDLNSLQWSQVSASHDTTPPARCFPVMIPVIQPLNAENTTGSSPPSFEVTSVCLFGGLGRPDRPVPLDDCWLLSGMEHPSWRPLSIANAEPLWGAAAVPAGINRWLICGGYGSPPEGVRLLSIVSERGRMKAQFTNIPGGGDPQLGRRCFAQGVLMKCSGQVFTPVELGVADLLTSSATQKNLLFLYGGVCEQEEQAQSMSVFEVVCSSPAQITAVRFIKTVSPQNRPFSTYTKNPSPRLCDAVAFIMAQPPPSSSLRLGASIPTFFVSGGFTVASTSAPAPIPPDFTITELVTVTGVDPFGLNSGVAGEERRTAELVDAEVYANPPSGEDAFPDIAVVPSLVDKRGVNTEQIRKMFQTLDEQIRHYPPWLTSLTYTPSLLTALGSAVPWPFAPIGNLLENASHLTTRATSISMDIGVTKNSGQMFLAVSDDGRGLGYSGVHKLLKRFGVGDNRPTDMEHHKSHLAVSYGMGFKIAAARLGRGCLVISRTHKCLGVALLSQRFLREIGASSTAATPGCFWKLPQRDTILTQQEHLLNQHKIFKFSPFKKVQALAEQINLIGLRTGTRMLFFDEFDSWATNIGVNVKDGLPHLRQTAAEDADGEGDLVSLDTCVEPGESSCPIPADLLKECALNRESYFVSRAGASVFDAQVGLSSVQESGGPIIFPPHSPGDAADSSMEPESTFPFWTDAQHSIDHCLATYMYWTMLFNATTLRCCGWTLMPSTEDHQRSPPGDPFDTSLYRFLKRRLHGLVELDWLFTPEDSGQDCFGLLGFVNPLETLVAGEPGERLKYHETGILLYYKERLIRRLFVPFPADVRALNHFATKKYPKQHFEGEPTFLIPCSGVIHVPEWLQPTMYKDEFVANRSAIFDEFVRKLKLLISEYLVVCLDGDRRREWIDTRGKKFLEEAGRRRPLSPMLHVSLLKKSADTTS